ncbi:MAG: energy-coupling factor transporter transmembrane protein EcfT [Syntrophomonas sp.]
MQAYSTGLNSKNTELDAGIKLVLAILLAVASAFCKNGRDLVYFSIFLFAITVFLKSDLRFILKNLFSFGIIILTPYLFGILLSLGLNRLNPGPVYSIDLNAALLKMTRIFFIWYIGNLYFFTTSLEAIMDMFDKVFSPLNRAGIPVSRYLNMIMFIVNELSRTVGQFKGEIFEQAGLIFKNRQLGIKTRLKELAHIIVNYIANSLQRTDEIQEQVELSCVNNCQYTLRISKNEIAAILGCIIFLVLLFA